MSDFQNKFTKLSQDQFSLLMDKLDKNQQLKEVLEALTGERHEKQ